MSYTKKQFDGCSFNPLAEGKMLTEYPRLCEIIAPEWTEDPNLDAILRFIVMVYDPASPLIKGERDLNYRMSAAFELSGIEDEELITLLKTHQHLFVVDLFVRYSVRFSRSVEFAIICALEYKLWEAIRQVMTPISGKGSKEELEAAQKKEILSEGIDSSLKRLENYWKAFFGGDDELEKKAKKRISPELIASK